jgi:hypothetical protein
MITTKQLDNFIFDPAEPPVVTDSIVPVSGISWTQPIDVRDKFQRTVWTSDKVDMARKSLNKSMGVNDLITPGPVEQQNRLDFWWQEEGQFLPRHVLDQLGIVGGEKVPTLKESIELENKQQVTAVKDFLGIERPIGKDPLGDQVILPETGFLGDVTDPKSIPDPLAELEKTKPKLAEIIKSASIEDLEIIRNTITNNPFEFEEGTLLAVNDEMKIKRTIPNVIEAMKEKPLIVLLGTDFFNKIGFNLPEFTSRKGLSPVENLLGLEKGQESIWIRSVARVRELIAEEDPRILTRIGLEAGGALADLMKFVAIPDPSKAKVFASLSPAAKAAIGVGTKAGLVTLLQAPEVGETFDDRAFDVAISTGVGAAMGYIFSIAISGLEKTINILKGTERKAALKALGLKENATDEEIIRNARSLAKKFHPDKTLSELEKVKAVKQFKEFIKARDILIEKGKIKGKFFGKRTVPTGFRAGFAEIEKPAKIVAKVVKKAPKAKEALAIEAAKKALALKIQPAAKVKPVKILTKKEALSLKESNLITGEGEKVRIVADAKTQRLLQTKENEIAKLKTRRNELMAQKQFAVAKTKAQEIAKKEEALIKLKEKAGIKLEQTIEGAKEKIAKIREAVEFKNELRNDAVSMITAIPKELRARFISRANRVKTLKGLQKLTDEVEVGIKKFETKIAVGDLKDTIKKLESKNRLGKVRMGKIPSPQREKIIEIIDEISTKKISTQLEPPPEEVKTFGELDVKARRGREQLLGADLQSLQKVTQRLSSELAGGLEKLDADTEQALRLPNERIRRLNLLTQKNVDELDVSDIELVTQSLQQFANNAKLKSKLLIKKGLKPLDGAIKTITEEEIAPTKRKVVEGEPVEVVKGKLQKVTEFGKKIGKLDDSHLDTLVQLSTNPDSKVMKQILDTDLHEGARKSAEKLVEWIDRSAERFEKIGFTDTDQISREVEVVLGGKKIKVERDFLIKLELHSRSPENLKAILTTEGWAIGDIQIDYPEDIDRLAELKEILKIVREDSILRGIADWTNELTPVRAAAINETSELLNGYPLAREPFYTSRPRSLPRRVEGGKDISVPPEQQGRYLPRTGGTKRLKLERWSNDFLSGLELDATMHGMAIPLRNARILVSSDTFQTAMKNAGRGLELQNIITILRRTQGVTTSRSTLEVFGGFIQRGVTVSALGFRMSTIGTQAMSYPAAFSEVESFMKPMLPVGTETLDRITEDSPLMALRWKGRRIGVEVGTSASFEAFETLFFGKSKKLSNKSLRGMITGDKFAIGNIYKRGVVPEILIVPRNGKNVDVFTWEGENVADLPVMNDPDSKVFRYAAARRLEYIVRRTQPMFDMLDRSVSLSNPSVLERSFFIFRTALEAQENIIIRATDTYVKSAKTFSDKKALTEDIGSVVVSAFSVAAWKRGLRWAIATSATAALAAFGIFKFDDKRERESMPENIAKDTAKNLIRLTKMGKFAVEIGERVANSISGEGYNWNRNSFDNPALDVLQTGADAAVAVSQAIADAGLTDEFVEEVTSADKEFNKQLQEKILNDFEKAIRSSFEFGVRISGQPLLAPVQEFLRPALADSKIKIIKEVTFDDVESPQQFSERVFALFELRRELNIKSKKKRLESNEEQALAILNSFATKANSTADIIKETEKQELRKLQFGLFESNISIIENNLLFLGVKK